MWQSEQRSIPSAWRIDNANDADAYAAEGQVEMLPARLRLREKFAGGRLRSGKRQRKTQNPVRT